MRIRTNFFVSAYGYVSGTDGRPVQLLMPGFSGAGSYGREFGALSEVWFHIIPMFLGTGKALVREGTEQLPLTLLSTRTFPDGVVELGYAV